ncbi:hypothetical protein [Paractinoplanes durhamensis]|uniref:PqqD family protein n=1 Tax=Paractinoplanes durhamensis TaxID=113563 RepID=A0ABQ3Z8S5_9ACTN|nr:hypothetical protein [Actinoplanes durhamensis]GIE06220.1 hypothetical protein Adu01nite_75700 [Actinoplanes durhamensis]
MTDGRITFHPLSFVPEGADVVVGRGDTGTYAVLPHDGAALLRRLIGGSTAAEAATWYERNFGEAVDVDDFLGSLTDLGFVTSPGSAVAGTATAPRFQWLGRALFSAPAWLIYAAVVVLALIELAGRPDLRPAASHVYFTASLVTVQVVLMFGTIPLSFLHEAYHVLAGQRLGLHSRLGISNRYNFVVFETKNNGLLSVRRGQRYLPFLAGMLIDVVMAAAFTLAAGALAGGGAFSAYTSRLCLALCFSIVARLAWQLLLHLRTDLYYVLSTALNCYDLHDASRSILANRFRRLTGRTSGLVDETQWTDRDRRVGSWYGWFIALGFAGTVVLAVVFTVPIAVTYAARAVQGVLAGTGTWHFWDSLISLAILAVQFVLPAVLAWRKRRHHRARKPRLRAS